MLHSVVQHKIKIPPKYVDGMYKLTVRIKDTSIKEKSRSEPDLKFQNSVKYK
jgi:hypothetical protein